MTGSESTLALEARVDDGPSRYEFRTVDGLHSSDAFRDSELLVLEQLWEESVGDLLVVAANYGVVGTVLAGTAESVTMTETSARAARLCRENRSTNGVAGTVALVESPADVEGRFDTVAYAPRGYTPTTLGKQRLVDALATLRPGGELFVAGRTQTGLNRYESCLGEHCDTVETVRKRDADRVLRASRPVGFDPPAYVDFDNFEATVDGIDLSLVSAPGLFSPGKLDAGSRLLLETATVEDGEAVLDLACGYGPVGAYAASAADCEVVLTDDDARATACARRTLDANNLEATVLTADCGRGIERTVDRILCNPPTHAGTGVLSDLFGRADDLLVPGGTLAVVHHRTLDLDEYLGQVGRIDERHHGQEHTVVTVTGR